MRSTGILSVPLWTYKQQVERSNCHNSQTSRNEAGVQTQLDWKLIDLWTAASLCGPNVLYLMPPTVTMESKVKMRDHGKGRSQIRFRTTMHGTVVLQVMLWRGWIEVDDEYDWDVFWCVPDFVVKFQADDATGRALGVTMFKINANLVSGLMWQQLVSTPASNTASCMTSKD